MSEVDQLLTLINSVLQSEDKAQREAAEQALVGLRTSNPNELLLAFLVILAGKYLKLFRTISDSSKKFLCISIET